MNLTDITNFFRSRRSSVFIDLASKYMAVVPQDKAQAVLTLFLYAYKTINQSLPPDRDLEELKLLLAKSLPELDTDELADNAEKAVNHAGALDAAHRLATIPVSDRLLLASAILELDKAVTPLKEENRAELRRGTRRRACRHHRIHSCRDLSEIPDLRNHSRLFLSAAGKVF